MKLQGLSEKVFLDRYSLKDKKGKSIEKTPSEMWRRVARATAALEKTKEDQKKWEREFYESMKDFKYVPGGRILAGAGTGYNVTFYNCFVLPSPADSRGGILETLKQMVEIMARGGGVGINLSSLRPRGFRVEKVNGFSSGPCNWAELFSVATKDIIQQGGCFTGDTRIMTHLGLVKIEDIVASKRTYFAETHKGPKEITARFDNGRKEVFEVETKGGYKVKTTSEHKFLTFDENGSFYLKPLLEFKTGEHLVLLPAFYNNDIPEVILRHDLPMPSKHSHGRKIYNLPKILTADLAFILGVYATDGSRMKDKWTPFKGMRFAVDGKRKKDLAYLTNLIHKVFGATPYIRKGDGNVMQVEVSSVNIAEFLRFNNLIKENSNKVFVPEQIFTSPQRVVEAFISGVFFGDGGNRGGKGGFRITSVNKKFLEDIQLLLLNLGIPSKLTVQLRETWQDLYTLNINGARYMKRFFNIVAPRNEKAYDNPVSVRDGFFNFPRNVLKRFAYLLGIQRTIAYANPSTSYKTMSFIEDSYRWIDIDDTQDAEILISTVADSIKSITPAGVEHVYDLEVEDVHLLSGNGSYSSNSRRGALMLMLWDWHPDVEEFITVKQDLTRINGANLSVCVSDSFMDAVEKDGDWDLVFPDRKDPEYDTKWDGDIYAWKAMGKKVVVHKTIKARAMWDLIAEAAWRSAEPGVVFMERYNKLHNNWYWNRINCVNPCGEEGLPPWGVCNLGSINLSALVRGNSIDKKGTFDFRELRRVTRAAVRFQDNVIEMDPYVFEGIRKTQYEGERRIGLGTMGLGDTLIKLHMRYGSPESLKFIDKIYKIIRDEAYAASVEIASEKGSFGKFDAKLYPQGKFIQRLPDEIQTDIKKKGIRNSILLMQAPTGSTSLLVDTTSGIEPVYEYEFIRRDRIGEHVIRHHLYEKWYAKHGKDLEDKKIGKPEWFVSANDLTPEDHVHVQAIIQKYVDASISKTVNAPSAHTVEDVKRLYTLAYKLGCKGIAYMREGSRAGVLERVDDKKKEEAPPPAGGEVKAPPITKRPPVMYGLTYKTQTPLGDAFITINKDEGGNPFEAFITIGKSGSDVAAMTDALGRMISLALRLQSPVPARERVRQIVAQLSGIGGMRTIGFGEKRVRSVPDAVAKVLAEEFGFSVNGVVRDLQKNLVSNGQAQANPSTPLGANGNGISNGNGVAHLNPDSIGVNGNPSPAAVPSESQAVVMEQLSISTEPATHNAFDFCPSCGAAALAHEEGCKKCYSCGYSEC